MKDFILKFGKFRGQMFLSTPSSYQSWLLSQDWFKIPSDAQELKTYALLECDNVHTEGLSYEDAIEAQNRHQRCFPELSWNIVPQNQISGLEKLEGMLERHSRISARYFS
jgi:uncharacterized protein (DUF3820 family)